MTALVNLTGKTGLIVGIANQDSIAYGCAQVLRAAGADLALTCRKEREAVAQEPSEEAFATTWPTWRGAAFLQTSSPCLRVPATS